MSDTNYGIKFYINVSGVFEGLYVRLPMVGPASCLNIVRERIFMKKALYCAAVSIGTLYTYLYL